MEESTPMFTSLLRNYLLPFIDALVADGAWNIIFQQDNASSHTSKKTREWFRNVIEEHGFTVMDWPLNSPDMNPIEHLWVYLKNELHQRYPDTKTLYGSPETIRKMLRLRLLEVWWDIGEQVLDRLVESMPHRVQALLEAEGWYTTYSWR